MVDNSPQINLGTLTAAVQNSVQALNKIYQAIVAAFPQPLTSSATWNPPSIGSGAQATTTVTVSGAVLGYRATASFSLDLSGLTMSSYVSSANTVTVVLFNSTGGSVDLASGLVKTWVWST